LGALESYPNQEPAVVQDGSLRPTPDNKSTVPCGDKFYRGGEKGDGGESEKVRGTATIHERQRQVNRAARGQVLPEYKVHETTKVQRDSVLAEPDSTVPAAHTEQLGAEDLPDVSDMDTSVGTATPANERGH